MQIILFKSLLLRNYFVLWLDEPTAQLDQETKNIILHTISNYCIKNLLRKVKAFGAGFQNNVGNLNFAYEIGRSGSQPLNKEFVLQMNELMI